MSRCYPYPPPGYEKKAPAELAISPKKEKHKHKDKEKKKKRKKDGEANGDSSHRDKDKRSKKSQQTGVIAVGNGTLPESKATTSAAAHEGTSVQGPTDISRDKEISNKFPVIDREADSKVGSQQQLVSVRTSDNGGVKTFTDVAPTRTSSHVEDEQKTEKQVHLSPVEMVWSAIDDQEWLSLCNPSGQKRSLEQSGMPQVWAETMYLPSVGIHALPYVVPY